MRATNVVKTEHRVSADEYGARNGHLGGVLWLTGLPGAGKSTLAFQLERRLFDLGYQVYVLDGDNLRHGLNADLGFTHDDRAENIRRAGEVAALFGQAGLVCIAAFISPYRADRDIARAAGGERFYEIYVKASVATCERRDPKGHYKRARAGEIKEFTGVDAPYEPPSAPDLTVDTEAYGIEECASTLERFVSAKLSIVKDPLHAGQSVARSWFHK
jgi:bifunctional enzyme CysN/CysC